MNVRLITGQVFVLAVLVAFYFLVVRPDSGASTLPPTGEEALVADFAVDRVKSISLRKWNKDEKREDFIELEKMERDGEGDGKERWAVTSRFGYAAKNEKIGELFDEIRELKEGPKRGENPDLWSSFEIDETQAATVAFKDGSGNALLTVHLGKVNYSMRNLFKRQTGEEKKDESTTYIRLNDAPEVFEIPGSHTVSLKPSEWLDLEILKEEFEKIEAVRLQGEEGDIRIMRKPKEETEEEKKEDEKEEKKGEKKPEYDWFLVKSVAGRGDILVKAKKHAAENLIRNIASLSGNGVAEPMEIGKDETEVSEALKKKYGFDKPVLTVLVQIARDGAQPVVKSLEFGKVKTKEGDKEKETIYVYHPQKRSLFAKHMETAFGRKKGVETVQKIHVYTVEEWSFNNINKKPRELKEEAPEAKNALIKGVDWDELSGFEIARGKEKVRIRKRISDIAEAMYNTEIWASEDHWGCPVLTEKVEEFLKAIKGLQQGNPTVPGLKPKELGLDEDSATTIVLQGGGREVFRFTVGAAKKEDSKEFTFMTLPNQDPREVSGSHTFSAAPTAWLDLKVFHFEPGDLRAFKIISTDAGEILLIRQRTVDGQDIWAIRKPIMGRQEFEYLEADQENAGNIVTLLSRLSAKGLEKPVTIPPGQGRIPTAEVVPYGLDKPVLILAGVLANRQQILIHVGKGKEKDTYFAYIPIQRQVGPWGGADKPMKVRIWRLGKYIVEALS
ncbi:MAG: DUF4340 domain-containing protein, partial [Planctomycetota bacterium]